MTGDGWSPERLPITAGIAEEVRRVEINRDASEDFLVWTRGARFTWKAAYEACRTAGSEVDWYESIWFRYNCMKFFFCAYRTIKERLMTRSRLRGFGMDVPSECVLCNNNQEETTEHLFFKCNYTARIWSICRLRLKLAMKLEYILREEMSETRREFAEKKCRESTLARLTLTGAVWHIWRERNQRIFEGVSNDHRAVMNNLDKDILDLMRPCNQRIGYGERGKQILCNWDIL